MRQNSYHNVFYIRVTHGARHVNQCYVDFAQKVMFNLSK